MIDRRYIKTAQDKIKVVCSFCEEETEKPTWIVKAAKKKGTRLYCNHVCKGKGCSVQRKRTEAEIVESLRLRQAWLNKPEVKERLRKYTQARKAKERYGEYWECSVLALDIKALIKESNTRYEIDKQKDILNKKQRRAL